MGLLQEACSALISAHAVPAVTAASLLPCPVSSLMCHVPDASPSCSAATGIAVVRPGGLSLPLSAWAGPPGLPPLQPDSAERELCHPHLGGL